MKNYTYTMRGWENRHKESADDERRGKRASLIIGIVFALFAIFHVIVRYH